jgi:hypothetical protein
MSRSTPGPGVEEEVVHHRDAGAIDFVKPKIQNRAYRPLRPGRHRTSSRAVATIADRAQLKGPPAPHLPGITPGANRQAPAVQSRGMTPKSASRALVRSAPPNNGKLSQPSFKKNCTRVLLQCGSSFLH